MASDGRSGMDSATCHTPRNSVAHCSFGSPIAAEDPFLKAPVDSASPRGSLTAQTIIESTQALEAELHNLRQLQDEKDQELAALRAAASGQTVGDSAECPAKSSLADPSGKAEAATGDTYSILSPTLSHLKHAYSRSCNLPLVGAVAHAGLWTADVCVSRTTKWASCEQVGKEVDSILQYLDEQVLSPHLQAAKSRSLSFCEPAIRRVEPLLVRSSTLFAGMLSAPRGFVVAFGHRAAMPAVWLREALQSWYGTPPGRLAVEDKLNRSADAASIVAASGIVARVGGDEQGVEAFHD